MMVFQFAGMVLTHVSYVEVASVLERVSKKLQINYYKYICKKNTGQTTAADTP